MNVKALKKEIKRLSTNLVRRFSNIKRIYGESPALYSWQKANIDYKVSNKNEKELKAILNNLKYFNSLKTSSVKGVKRYLETFGEIQNVLQQFPVETKNMFFEIYNKMVEENHLIEKYKYEVFNTIADLMVFGIKDEEKIMTEIRDLFDELYAESQGVSHKGISLDYEDTQDIL